MSKYVVVCRSKCGVKLKARKKKKKGGGHKTTLKSWPDRDEDCDKTTPQNTSKSHVVSHHSAVAMDTHIKLHHLPCPPFTAPPSSPPPPASIQSSLTEVFTQPGPPHLLHAYRLLAD